jgi:tetratricopeptide (TPR) repeat protein
MPNRKIKLFHPIAAFILLLWLPAHVSAATNDTNEQKLNVARNLLQAGANPEVITVLDGVVTNSTATPAQMAVAHDLRRAAFFNQQKPEMAYEESAASIRLQRQVTNGQEFLSAILQMRAWHANRLQDYAEADKCYRESVTLAPRNGIYLNALAWHLACCPDSTFHDGILAIHYATQSNTLSQFDVPAELDTLAAAFARAGRYDESIGFQERAMAHPKFLENRKPEDVKNYARRLQSYRDRKPHTDPRPETPPVPQE